MRSECRQIAMATEGRQEVKDAIASEIARVHLESYGQPVDNVVVALCDEFVALVMDIVLSPAEVSLVDGGAGASVQATRESYQGVIAPTFVAIVERASGRRVEGFASRTVIEEEKPSWSAEIFRLVA